MISRYHSTDRLRNSGLAKSDSTGMTRLRIATVAVTVSFVLFMTSGVANASPGSPYPYPWAPEWARPAVEAVGFVIGDFLVNVLQPILNTFGINL